MGSGRKATISPCGVRGVRRVAAVKKPDVVVDDGTVYVLRAGMPVYVKTADICAMIGRSNQWVGQLVSQGTISKRSTPHGPMFDLTATMRAYCDTLSTRAKPPKDEQEAKRENARSAADVTMKVAKATIAKLEADELQGKMHRSEDVAAMTEDLIYTIRGMLVALPGRLAVDVAATSTAAEAADVVRKEVFAVMGELANYRYDPQKYEERVRERRDWEVHDRRDADDE